MWFLRYTDRHADTLITILCTPELRVWVRVRVRVYGFRLALGLVLWLGLVVGLYGADSCRQDDSDASISHTLAYA